MKIRPVLIAAVLSGLVNGSFAREIRIFTNNSGKKIEAELLDLTEGKVRLMVNRKPFDVPVETLSAEDQEFLKAWDLKRQGRGDELYYGELVFEDDFEKDGFGEAWSHYKSESEVKDGVLVGKTATFEFALGGPSWDLPFPPALNPWNLKHLPGGSSSGSGAAVAARLVPAAIGTDTGGSVRWPAAVCGIAGLKPTYGRISRRGVHPNTFSLDHCGPMTRTVEDCALMLGATAGYDRHDPGSIDVPVDDYAGALTGSVKGLRIGLVRHWYENAATPEVTAAVDVAVGRLKELGAIVEEIRLSPLTDYIDAKTTISLCELYAIHEKDLKARPEDFGYLLRTRVIAGGLIRAEEYVQAMRWRTELSTAMLAEFRRFDLFATAGWLTTAEPADPVAPDFFKHRQIVTMPFSLAGIPALSVPCGFSADGLPLALQIAGRPFDEATVLRAGDAYQRATDWHLRKPPIA